MGKKEEEKRKEEEKNSKQDKKEDQKDKVEKEEETSCQNADRSEVEAPEEKEVSFEERIDELEAENERLLDGLMRLKADFENYRKRMIKEQTKILETAESELTKKLLPIIDNLERALLNARADNASPTLTKGIEMILTELLEILQKEGLEIINPEGMPFNPEQHEAMMVVETEECPEDTVVEVAQKGYKFRGLLLRPAMVKVSCKRKDMK